MDDMDIDHVQEVPDTPDRLASRHLNHNNLSPSAGSVEIPDSADQCSHHWPRDSGKIGNGIGQNRRPYIRPPKRIGNGSVNSSSPIVISPSDNSCTPHNSHLSRKLKIDRSSENEQGRSFRVLDIDGTRGICGVFSNKSFDCPEKDASIDFTGRNREDSCYPQKSVQALNKSSKGKEKAIGSTSTCSSMLRGKEADFSSVSLDESPKKLPQLSNSVSSPRSAGQRTGQKRLVRNGRISPHIMEPKDKELAVKHSSSSSTLSEMSNEVSNGSPSCAQLDKIVADPENHDRNKGKGILLHPCSSKEHKTNLFNAPTSYRNSTMRSNDEYKGIANPAVDVLDGFENQGGWRSTRNQLRSGRAGTAANICEIVAERRNYPCESKRSSRSNYAADKNSCLTTSRHVSGLNGVDEAQHFAITRPNQRAFTSRRDAQSSRLEFDDSNVMFVGSSEESPDLSSVRLLNGRQRQGLGAVIDIDESSPEVRQSSPLIVDHAASPGSDARLRQVEADEMLARELQQQLYNESPMDEYVVQMLQQVEQNRASSTSSLNRRSSVRRGSSVSHSQRQIQPRSSQNLAQRRGRNSNASTRIQPSRRGSFRRSSTLLSRGMGFHFPMDMDLDMRIDILEALEDSIGDFDDIATSGTRALRLERDFNENDYEMLLALDENVRHVGTSSNQINSLPQSKVQTDVSEEACAICLDNPKFGETIRHLPCLHKFHKDCIDPWLSRSTSCPVCKSSVT